MYIFFNIYFLFIWLHWVLAAAHGIFYLSCSTRDLSCGMQTLSCSLWDLVPWLGIKPRLPALGMWSLSHWTTREVPRMGVFTVLLWYVFVTSLPWPFCHECPLYQAGSALLPDSSWLSPPPGSTPALGVPFLGAPAGCSLPASFPPPTPQLPELRSYWNSQPRLMLRPWGPEEVQEMFPRWLIWRAWIQ